MKHQAPQPEFKLPDEPFALLREMGRDTPCAPSWRLAQPVPCDPRTDPDAQPLTLLSPDGRSFPLTPIGHRESEVGKHGAHAPDALTRAIIVLRLLRGEREWGDGYERQLDDCFEMDDGDDVVRHLIAIALAVPEIKHLLTTHRNLGMACYLRWLAFSRTPARQLALL